MKIKTCMLVTGHPAIEGRIFYKEAKTLYKAGYEVHEIAPLDKNGFLVDMGKNPIARGEATIDGIKIIGFREGTHSIWGLPKTWTISQCLRLASNGKLNFGQDPYSELIKKGIEINADIYHCHEIASLYAGLKIKRELQKQGKNPKLIYDVHEYWSAKKGDVKFRDLMWSKTVKNFEKRAFSDVDYLITVNQVIRGYLLINSNFLKTEVLYNSPVLSTFSANKKLDDRDAKDNNEKIVICHEGRLTFDRGLKNMLETMKLLKESYGKKIQFLIIGETFNSERKYLEEKIKEYSLESIVQSTGWLPYEEVGNSLSKGDIGIILMESNDEDNLLASPNKLFNYMRYGLPIVTVDHSELRRIVLGSECGIVVKKRTAESLVEALSFLIDNPQIRQNMGENGKKAIIEKYSWEIMEKRLLRVYQELTSDSSYIM